MNFKAIINNKALVRILLPILIGVLSYLSAMQSLEDSFFSHVAYISVFNYLGLLLGFIVLAIVDQLGKKEALAHFLKNTHSYIIIFLFIILLIEAEKLYGQGFQMIFAGFFLWVTSELN